MPGGPFKPVLGLSGTGWMHSLWEHAGKGKSFAWTHPGGRAHKRDAPPASESKVQENASRRRARKSGNARLSLRNHGQGVKPGGAGRD